MTTTAKPEHIPGTSYGYRWRCTCGKKISSLTRSTNVNCPCGNIWSKNDSQIVLRTSRQESSVSRRSTIPARSSVTAGEPPSVHPTDPGSTAKGVGDSGVSHPRSSAPRPVRVGTLVPPPDGWDADPKSWHSHCAGCKSGFHQRARTEDGLWRCQWCWQLFEPPQRAVPGNPFSDPGE